MKNRTPDIIKIMKIEQDSNPGSLANGFDIIYGVAKRVLKGHAV
jgi:hypothetical protein